jgi:hypothetical protein
MEAGGGITFQREPFDIQRDSLKHNSNVPRFCTPVLFLVHEAIRKLHETTLYRNINQLLMRRIARQVPYQCMNVFRTPCRAAS